MVVVDLDNTLYDWVGFFVPALQAMVDALVEFLQRDANELIGQLREGFGAHGSVEYAFVAQGLPATTGLSLAERARLVEVVQQAFATARDHNLRLYPGVAATLDELVRREIRLVAATNAPLFQAQRRLRHLGVLDLFYGIIARESFPIPTDDPAIPAIVHKADEGHYECKLPWQRTVGLIDLKPSSQMYREVFSALAVPPARALVVGDSVAKDLVPACALGARSAWARYGTVPRSDQLEFLLRVTPWSAEAITEQYGSKRKESIATLDRFADLLGLV